MAIFAHINFPEHNEKNITQCLDISIPEIERLNKHPELFASKIVEEYFNYDVSQIRDTLIKVDLEMDKISEARDIFHESIEESFTDIFLFDETEERKSWQQFLHNNPQEGGYDDWYKPEAGSIQVIPTAAKLIIHKMKEDRRSVLQALGTVSSYAWRIALSLTNFPNPLVAQNESNRNLGEPIILFAPNLVNRIANIYQSPTQTWTTAKQSTRIVTLVSSTIKTCGFSY